jgi:hypothetical protein
MPVERRKMIPDPPAYQSLVNKLAAELVENTANGPSVIEEEQFGNRIHVTVIWDAWSALSPEDRGRAIMDAYQKVRPDEVLQITIAMGLTKADADKLKIPAYAT